MVDDITIGCGGCGCSYDVPYDSLHDEFDPENPALEDDGFHHWMGTCDEEGCDCEWDVFMTAIP